jgi:hypothetical protein
MQKNLAKNILATICYFDVQDYPLTAFELWKHMLTWPSVNGQKNDLGSLSEAKEKKSAHLVDVMNAIENPKLRKFIEEKNGFYFLFGRKGLVEKRIVHEKLSVAKIKIARRVARILKYVPFVRMLALTGTLAMKNSTRESDIDFFVISKAKHIWIARTLVTLVVQMMGVRRHEKKVTDRVCLNYYIADNFLTIERKDVFASNEYSFVFPIFGFQVFRNFCFQNDWINEMKPNYAPMEVVPPLTIEHGETSFAWQKTMEIFFDFVFRERGEKKLEQWETIRIEKNPLTNVPGSYVRYDENQLIFLPSPQGDKIFSRFTKRLIELTEFEK